MLIILNGLCGWVSFVFISWYLCVACCVIPYRQGLVTVVIFENYCLYLLQISPTQLRGLSVCRQIIASFIKSLWALKEGEMLTNCFARHSLLVITKENAYQITFLFCCTLLGTSTICFVSDSVLQALYWRLLTDKYVNTCTFVIRKFYKKSAIFSDKTIHFTVYSSAHSSSGSSLVTESHWSSLTSVSVFAWREFRPWRDSMKLPWPTHLIHTSKYWCLRFLYKSLSCIKINWYFWGKSLFWILFHFLNFIIFLPVNSYNHSHDQVVTCTFCNH